MWLAVYGFYVLLRCVSYGMREHHFDGFEQLVRVDRLRDIAVHAGAGSAAGRPPWRAPSWQ